MRLDLLNERTVARFLMALAAVIGSGLSAFGQSDPSGADSTKPAAAASEASKETAASTNDLQFGVVWVSTGGGYTYVPEKWAELRINVVNSRNEPRDLTCLTYFQDVPNLQFGRRARVPAKSVLRLSHPVIIPRCDPAKGRQLNLQSLVMDSTDGGDVLLKTRSGQLLHDGGLLVTLTPRNTGIIGTPLSSGIEQPNQDVAELIMACRVSQQLPNRFSPLLDHFLPADESEWNCLDQIVICENRIIEDEAALAALRHWVHMGGHLWVMLDQADPIVLERLLGDDFQGHVIDRVGLTTVRVDKASSLSDPGGDLGETFEHEEPVDFTRMTVNNFEVTHLVNGWPAAMVKPYGDGRVLITTLGPRGWMSLRPPGEKQPNDPTELSKFVPTAPMRNIASEFFGQREPQLLPQTAIEPQVREYVGYTVPSWRLIVGTLFAFSTLLIGAAIGLLRIGRIESLGWVGSLMAIAASMALLSIGQSTRQGIPATVANIQMDQAIPGTDDVHTQGVVAVYQPDESQAPIKVTGGGRVMPDITGLENAPRRMIMTDLGKWHWENLPQPPGLRATSFSRAETISDRIEARGTFDSNGLVGTLTGGFRPGTDALVATRAGRLGITLKENGTFQGRPEDVFEKDQYLSSGFVIDEQERHRRTLEQVFTNPRRKDYPTRPQLMFWTGYRGDGIQFGDHLKSQGATLVAVPLIFDRPPNGTEYLIPSPFLPYQNQRGPDGNPSSTMWNYGRNEWQERSTPGTAWLNIQIPQELLPVTVNRARIDMKVSGPVGRLEVIGLKNGAAVSLQTIMDPVGALAIEITDPSVLALAENGGLPIGISGGDPTRPELTQITDSSKKKSGNDANSKLASISKINYWRIESLTLQLWVKSTEPSMKD